MEFETLLNLGLSIMQDFSKMGANIVENFLLPLEERFPIIEGTALGGFTLLQIMFTVGLPVFLSAVIVKWVIDFVP